VYSNDIVVKLPAAVEYSHPEAQLAASKASIRALRSQAATLLPQRLEQLATKHDFSYTSVAIKQLKSRWGSCDQNGNITLNLFLMQLPWDCIDYVLLHELLHTRIMQHGPVFWGALTEVLPNHKELRRTIRGYQPVLHGHPSQSVA
jgi:predicted metal-dependent hydrolase